MKGHKDRARKNGRGLQVGISPTVFPMKVVIVNAKTTRCGLQCAAEPMPIVLRTTTTHLSLQSTSTSCTTAIAVTGLFGAVRTASAICYSRHVKEAPLAPLSAKLVRDVLYRLNKLGSPTKPIHWLLGRQNIYCIWHRRPEGRCDRCYGERSSRGPIFLRE